MSAFSRSLRAAFAPPFYLAEPPAGIDISVSGIKVAVLDEHAHGLHLRSYGELMLPEGVIQGGALIEPEKVSAAIAELAKKHHVRSAHVALPESRGYLFEANADGHSRIERRSSIESKLDEYVPLPPAEVLFDIAEVSDASVVGVGYARRVVDETLSVVEGAKLGTRSLESETFSLPRALLPTGSQETVQLIDIGKTTTKCMIVTNQLPRFVTTLDLGGHALTLAVQKYFGVSEEEAKRVKVERGIVPGEGNEDYLAAMLSTVSVIRDEIAHRLEYWQTSEKGAANPVTRVLLAGGNATVRGLPTYLQDSLGVPVELGDVFTNLKAMRQKEPSLDYTESLAYGTAIGLALRNYVD